MKRIPYIAAVLLLAACGGKTKEAKIAPETKLSLSAFDSEVKALAANLQEATARTAQYGREMRNLDSVLKVQVPSSLKGDLLSQVNEQVKACGERKQQLPVVQTGLESVNQEYGQAGKAYTEWSAQITKGELAEEEVNTGLETYRTKLNDLKNRTFALSDSATAIRLGFAKHLDSAQKLGGFKLK